MPKQNKNKRITLHDLSRLSDINPAKDKIDYALHDIMDTLISKQSNNDCGPMEIKEGCSDQYNLAVKAQSIVTGLKTARASYAFHETITALKKTMPEHTKKLDVIAQDYDKLSL